MWRIFTIFALSVFVVSASSTYSYSPISQRITPRETNTCDGRQSPGPICESCELLSTCVKLSNGWVNIPVETCDAANGFYCNSRLGMCSNLTGPCHPFGFEGNFPCTSQGVFPDPYDCQKYHMCYFVSATLVSATVDCGSDKAFNAATGQCSLSLQHPVCQQKQYECLHAGDANSWPNSSNIFYICKATSNQDERVLYPTLYRCNDGEFFDGYYCREGNPDGGSFPLPTGLPLPTSGPSDPNVPNVPGSGGTKCIQVGLMPDFDNCRKYFYCSVANATLKHMECPVGTYYNHIFSSCTLGSC